MKRAMPGGEEHMSDRIEPEIAKTESGNSVSESSVTLANARLEDLPSRKTDTSVDATVGKLEIASAADYPSTRQEQLQEFVDGFGKVGKLYNDTIQDPGRFAKFQDRMGTVYQNDRESFMDLAKVGDGLTGKPPSSPEKTGESLADAIANTIDRNLKTQNFDVANPEMLNLQGAVAGMMLAARANFDPSTMEAQTTAMVDALDKRLQDRGVPNIRGIIWGDNGEPGLAIVPANQTIDRQKYLP